MFCLVIFYLGVITRLKTLPRPMIVHFIQVIVPTDSSHADAGAAPPIAQKVAQQPASSKALPTFDGDDEFAPAVNTSPAATVAASSNSGGYVRTDIVQ